MLSQNKFDNIMILVSATISILASFPVILQLSKFQRSEWAVYSELFFVSIYTIYFILCLLKKFSIPKKFLIPTVFLHMNVALILTGLGSFTPLFIILFIPLFTLVSDKKFLFWSVVSIISTGLIIMGCIIFPDIRMLIVNTFTSSERTINVNSPAFFALITTLYTIFISTMIILYIYNKLLHKYILDNVVLKNNINDLTNELKEKNNQLEVSNSFLESENVRLKIEFSIAKKLQEMILPNDKIIDEIKNYEISIFSNPANEVGGDYYDILKINNKIVILIGDVTGHDLTGMLIMLMIHSCVRTLINNKIFSCISLLNNINTIMYKDLSNISSNKNITLTALIGDEDGNFSISGQHEMVVVVKKDGKVDIVDTLELGYPVGLIENINDLLKSKNLLLDDEDILFLYTDGLIEAINDNKEEYGLDKIVDVIKKNRHKNTDSIRDLIVDDIYNFIGGQKIYDDMTFLIIKKLGVLQ